MSHLLIYNTTCLLQNLFLTKENGITGTHVLESKNPTHNIYREHILVQNMQ